MIRLWNSISVKRIRTCSYILYLTICDVTGSVIACEFRFILKYSPKSDQFGEDMYGAEKLVTPGAAVVVHR